MISGGLPSPPEWDLILSASQKNYASEIRRLVEEEGVPATHSNVVGQTALHIACLWGSVESVQALIDLGADVNAQNRIAGATPLHCAIRGTFQSFRETHAKRVKCIILLLEAGGDTALCDLRGADAFGYLNDVEQEAQMGGLGNIKQQLDEMRSALETASQPKSELLLGIKNNDFDGVKRSLANEVDQKEKNLSLNAAAERLGKLIGDSINQQDAFSSLSNIIEYLLKAGADPNSTTNASKQGLETDVMPLHIIASSYCTALVSSPPTAELSASYVKSIIQNLKAYKASIGAGTNSLLPSAAHRGRLSVVQFLVGVVGVDPNVRGRQGMTSLHFASRMGKFEVVKWLLESSGETIDLNILDNAGKKAIDYATANNKHDIVDMLKKLS